MGLDQLCLENETYACTPTYMYIAYMHAADQWWRCESKNSDYIQLVFPAKIGRADFAGPY